MKLQSPMDPRAEYTTLQDLFIPLTSPLETKPLPSNFGRQQLTQPSHHLREARETYKPVVKHGVAWPGRELMLPTTTSADNSAKTTLKSSETATGPTSAASPLIVLRSKGPPVLGRDAKNTRDDGKRPKKRHEGPLNTEQRAKVLRIFGSCSDCQRRRVACQPAHHNITWEDLDRWWSTHSNIRSSAEKGFAPAAAEHLQQQSHPPFQEGTVADSGYVSACASRPCHEMDRGTMVQPEEHDGPAGDQHTVYTSLGVPHGSDYITDLCNDIHLKLKHEFMEHTQDQRWGELPKRLPDLIKALAIRIGLDRSNPASPYVMHFLHTHSK